MIHLLFDYEKGIASDIYYTNHYNDSKLAEAHSIRVSFR